MFGSISHVMWLLIRCRSRGIFVSPVTVRVSCFVSLFVFLFSFSVLGRVCWSICLPSFYLFINLHAFMHVRTHTHICECVCMCTCGCIIHHEFHYLMSKNGITSLAWKQTKTIFVCQLCLNSKNTACTETRFASVSTMFASQTYAQIRENTVHAIK